MPSKVHIALWRDGVRRATSFGRYPALLVSLHADTIYGRYFNFDKATPGDAETVRAFLDEQRRFQMRTATSLRQDPKTCKQASPENIENNRLLIAALDKMSLEICWGVKTKTNIPELPTASGESVEFCLLPGAGETLSLDPWPFLAERITVQAEGKRLRGRFSTQSGLNRALNDAEPVLVIAELRSA